MSEAATETNTTPAVRAQPLSEAETVFALSQRQAKALSKSELVPVAFQGDKGIPNCLIAMNLAHRIGADPLMVMQSLDVIHGKPSFSAKFLVACINACGRFKPLQYRITGEGDSLSCVAHTETLEGVPIEGPEVTMAMAKAEGWVSKSGSKWKTMPGLMIRYRAAAFFARTVCPELTMGMGSALTTEEEEDLRRSRATESRESAAAALRSVTATAGDGPEDIEIDPETGEVVPPLDAA